MNKEILNRTLLWSFAGIVLVGSVFALASLANKQAPSETAPILASLTTNEIEKGDPLSAITITEYSDFQCPACRTYLGALSQIDPTILAKARFVFRHFPLPGHANARIAAQAAEAARVQGKFWEMHDMLFLNQPNWEESKDARTIFIGYAKELKLDATKFQKDIDSAETKKNIDEDVASGNQFGVNATPTFFINDTKLPAPKTFEEFKKTITDAITTATN